MEKHKNCTRLRLLGDKKANKTENMAEIVFFRGASEIQCLVYHQNNVDPFEICNKWIQLNMVFQDFHQGFWFWHICHVDRHGHCYGKTVEITCVK